MGDDTTELLDTLVDKVMHLADKVSTFKVDRGCLHVAINNLQSKKLETGKLRFPKYNSFGDLLTWLHHCEHYFQAARTYEDEKVWPSSFYMEGDALLKKQEGDTRAQ